MASNLSTYFPASLLVEFKQVKVPVCERHAKIIIGLNALAGKYTPVEQNLNDDDCGDCVLEEEKRIEAEKQRAEEGKPAKKGKRHGR